jgi:hypothetical protein
MTELTLILGAAEVKWIVILIMIDVLLGIVAALMKKDFRLGKVAKFMVKPVLGYVFGFAILGIVAQVTPSLSFVAQIAYILIILALIGSITNNIDRMGVGLPDFLKK